MVFLAGYLLTCGDVESNPGPGPGERLDYPWCQPAVLPRTPSLSKRHAVPASDLPTRHATTALRDPAYTQQLSDDTAKLLQQMDRQQTTLSNTLF